jgi:uncharacterized protein (DUF302 family)
LDTALTVTRSASDYVTTTGRLVEGIERRGLRIFARIDHAAAARDVGLDLANEQVFVFGDPRAGTPLMLDDPRVGIELPLRILVWEDDQGTVLTYRDPRELAGHYEIVEHRPTLEAMGGLLQKLVEEASGQAI